MKLFRTQCKKIIKKTLGFIAKDSFPGRLIRNRSGYKRYLKFLFKGLFVYPKLRASDRVPIQDPDYPRLAVASIALGNKYLSWCRAMIETLRTRGRFTGPVYVFTDRPDVFDKVDNVITVKVPATNSHLTATTYKTILIDCIPHDYILYIDVDIVIANPISLLMDEVKHVIDKVAFMVFEETGERTDKYHAGVLLLNRKHAQPLMYRWRKSIQVDYCYKDCDQHCLNAILRDSDMFVLPARHLVFFIPELLDGQNKSVFVHITFTFRQKKYSQEINKYLKDVLHLNNIPIIDST